MANAEKGKANPAAGIHMVTFSDPQQVPAWSDSGVTVQGASGALLRAAPVSGSRQGVLYVVDGTGAAYPVPDDDDETLKRLGFQSDDVTAIPRSWINVFHVGVSLSIKDAGTSTGADASTSTGTSEKSGTVEDAGHAGTGDGEGR